MVRPTVVLPQPDSPTMPSVSPFLMEKLTSSTACTCATTRCITPARTGKYFFKFCTAIRSGCFLTVDLSLIVYDSHDPLFSAPSMERGVLQRSYTASTGRHDRVLLLPVQVAPRCKS